MAEKNFKDSHHLLWERRSWNATPEGRILRQTHGLIPTMDREWHEAIHHDLPPVPLLGSYALRRTLMGFEATNDPIINIERLAGSMERATKDSHPLERDLAGLAIQNLIEQRPYVMDGIIGKPRLIVVNNFEGLQT